jgi:hypothetical protein
MLLAQEIMLVLTGSLIVLAVLVGSITELARKSQSTHFVTRKRCA